MEVIINFCFVIVIGPLSLANALDQFCSGEICFFRPEPISTNTWSAAQQRCKDNYATLPIADNPDHQESIVEALSHYQLNGMDVWLGADAFNDNTDNWRWLDGRQYKRAGEHPPDVQGQGEYYKSYAYVAKKGNGVLAYATAPNSSYSYICQYNFTTSDICRNDTGNSFVMESRCYTKYAGNLSWFSARNACLLNKGDLASFSQLSLLDAIVDFSGFWVGLRHSHWDWRNATGASSDVTFTSWRVGQPNDAVPRCMATDVGDYPNWKDINCTLSYSYICQGAGTSTLQSSTTSSISTTTTSTRTTPSSNSHAPVETPESTRKSVSSSTPTIENSQTSRTDLVTVNKGNAKSNDDEPVNKALAIGLGVGLGVPFLIIIVVIIVVVVLRRRRRNSAGNGNAHSTKKFVTNNGQNGADNGMMEMTGKKNKKGRKGSDNTPAHYATVREVNPGSKVDPPSSQDAGYYADLRFASQGS